MIISIFSDENGLSNAVDIIRIGDTSDLTCLSELVLLHWFSTEGGVEVGCDKVVVKFKGIDTSAWVVWKLDSVWSTLVILWLILTLLLLGMLGLGFRA